MRRSGLLSGWRKKFFVTDAHVADNIVCAARTGDPAGDPADGNSLPLTPTGKIKKYMLGEELAGKFEAERAHKSDEQSAALTRQKLR